MVISIEPSSDHPRKNGWEKGCEYWLKLGHFTGLGDEYDW